MDQNEQNLQMALADFKAGKFKSSRQAAIAYGVPPATFNDRLNGKKPRQIAYQYEHEQQLTPIPWTGTIRPTVINKN
ncbi:uncharacterized protein K441DRAFT_650619 [Cenococcum geophilum 1.58]|uniref:uncharacterized protein n=1 Tax=Cenococcum geophilum 1.58 TaxID=794803 RepID=UPI00358E436C|nr:hypothetical protein K441DRAFT_650619 [Cenococcum geophilum 1.58]